MWGRIALFGSKAVPVLGQVVMAATIIVEVAAIVRKVKGRA